jgi:AraC family transcriptional regulator, arabinose operon regulatory protein
MIEGTGQACNRNAEITDHRILSVIDLITYSIDRPDINRLARAVNLSASRLRHLFKEQTGVSFKHYLRLIKLERAAHLLENTFLKVKDICEQVDAGDVSRFVKDFEKEFGMSPARYRNHILKEKSKENLQILSRIAKSANK